MNTIIRAAGTIRQLDQTW